MNNTELLERIENRLVHATYVKNRSISASCVYLQYLRILFVFALFNIIGLKAKEKEKSKRENVFFTSAWL